LIFDPFGDFAECGYLRNCNQEKDLDKVKILEHFAFQNRLDDALEYLSVLQQLSYVDVLQTHKILFGDLYPWAGQDRKITAPGIAVSKGEVLFAHPQEIKLAVDYALLKGQDTAFMINKPGEVMGYLAHGHPFLDGNGRTIMVVHTVLAQRAGLSIDWKRSTKNDYLTALTKELERPGKGHLDSYLNRLRGKPIGRMNLSGHLNQVQGLNGLNDAASMAENVVLGSIGDPDVQTRYKAEQQQRAQSDPKYKEQSNVLSPE
jgi:cell filamentation protein